MPVDQPPAAPLSTWGDALHWGTSALAHAQATPTPSLDAAILLGHVAGTSRALLLAYPERGLTGEQSSTYVALVSRRLRGEPVAYLTGRRAFMDLEFLTDSRALIPRPETELLVEVALADIRARLAAGAAPVVADIGTGNGAIAIALAAHEPRLARVYATDISAEALTLASENAARLGVADRVTLLRGDLVAPLPGPVDLLLANLPYVAPRDAPTLPPDVRTYEPALALYGADDGLGHFRRLFADLSTALRSGAVVYLEFGYDQRPAVVALARAHLPTATIHVIADYAGWDRILVARMPDAPTTT
jgi:release factor glutamine methyltransferase